MVKWHRFALDAFAGFMILYMMLLMAADGLGFAGLWRFEPLVGGAALAATIVLLISLAVRIREAG